jgi:N-acetylmuramoyl-L-alanine amidase
MPLTANAADEGSTEGTAAGQTTQTEEPAAEPVVVTGLRADPLSYTSVKISWNKVEKAVKYKVSRSLTFDGEYLEIGENVDCEYTDSGLTPGTTYYYKVAAENEKGELITQYAGPVSAAPQISVPTAAAETSGSGNLISWSSVYDAEGYEVYRSSAEDGEFDLIGTTVSTEFTDYSTASGSTVYYKIRPYLTYNGATVFGDYSEPVAIQTVFRVYIACGHGIDTHRRWDSGCIYRGRQEARLMLPITKAMVAYLRGSGVYVYTDADTGNNLNMKKCVRIANRKKISAYVSIHCDCWLARRGTMPLYRSAGGRRLANSLNRSVHRNISIRNKGLVKRYDLYELNKTKVASCIYETGSIRGDYRKIRKYNKYGKALAQGMCSYLGVEFTGTKE